MCPRTALLALLVVTSGCLGVAPSDDGTASTATSTPTQTTAGATTSYFDCPYYLSVDTVTETDVSQSDRVVAYENLTDARREEFDRLLEHESVELETLPDRWSAPTVVEHGGAHYEVVASTC
ncbi:hypothetical protein SAMN04487948_102183 [Halogranum amylolyticum]|uniref:DUF7979 domain-containing protein n=1 Tax=Halogranum amylolyticum TaxID=660520 RepID=A0A1H8PAU2_9EURY|nr:hypothetical protein [Halogranum amylolyticum]SEO38844.1 hypothetical protein SAMN04487948_102183 [Halogranum amylolyticum]